MTERQAAPPDAPPRPSEQEVRDYLARLDGLDTLSRGAAPRAGAERFEANLIGVLQAVQDRFGHLPPAALAGISRRTGIALSRICGVVSFYAQFYTEPRGRHTIRCCRGTACHVKGADRVLDAVRRTLGIDEGQTTDDLLFYLETVACLGACFLAPAMMIDNHYYGKLTPQRVESILKSYQAMAR
jgi:NADH-quinone oxidoreductase subunit E